MRTDEVELVRQAKSGDRRAFEGLFRSYQATIYSLALRFTGSTEAAADLTQDAFVRAWEQLPRLRQDGAFGGWLRSILLNLARDGARSQQDTASLDEDPSREDRLPDSGMSVENVVVQGEYEQSVRRAVMSLPAHQRVAVVMHHLEGMEIDDIARTLGLKRGTVLSRLSRARSLLKRKLEGRL